MKHLYYYNQNKKTVITTLLVLISICLFGQNSYDYSIKGAQPSKKKIIKIAEKAYEKGDFNSALGLYEFIADQDTTDIAILHRTAEIANELNAIIEATKYYQIAARHEKRSMYPMLDYSLAKNLRILGKYDEAIASLDRFILAYANTDQLSSEQIEKARQERKEVVMAKASLNAPESSFKVERMDYSINTDYFSEFAPVKKDGKLYYTRLYYASDADTTNLSKAKFGVYVSNGEASGLNSALKEDEQNSNASFSADGQYMYDTQCEYIASQKRYRCQIYRSEKDALGSWINRKALSSNINLQGFNTTHPNIVIESDGNEVLYFSSDRPSGLGQMDIWKSSITRNTDGTFNYGEPVNLGPNVNTPEDDITPFYHAKCEILYFSTKGRPSLGGFDIYSARWNGYAWETPESLGYPVNSSFDDMYFFRDETGVEAYFASNRIDPEVLKYDRAYKGCCPDIYTTTFNIKADLDIAVFCGGERLANIPYAMNGFTPRSEAPQTLDAPIALALNEQYKFETQRVGYTKGIVEIQTKDICETTKFSERVYIRPLENWTIKVLQEDKTPLDNVKITLRNKVTGDILHEKITTLGTVTFSVEPNSLYEIELTKEGFLAETREKATLSREQLCTLEDSITLIEELPTSPSTTLYFHNAIPSKNASSLLSYEETYDNYLKMKNQYVQSLSNYYRNRGDDIMADSASLRLLNFFENEVQAGFQQLQKYLVTLDQLLKRGKSVTVVLRGTASSRGNVNPEISRKTNQALSERRVNSVVKYMRTYGDLAKYMDSGMLIIQKEPLGMLVVEQQYEQKMLEDFGVYDPIAAKLRSVQILDIIINN